jgi:hypothetical protein
MSTPFCQYFSWACRPRLKMSVENHTNACRALFPFFIDIDIVLIETKWRQNGSNDRQADQGALRA